MKNLSTSYIFARWTSEDLKLNFVRGEAMPGKGRKGRNIWVRGGDDDKKLSPSHSLVTTKPSVDQQIHFALSQVITSSTPAVPNL